MNPKPKTGKPRTAPAAGPDSAMSALHLRVGWWALFWFLLLGLVLEAFHGFKVAWYLEIANTTRRLSWTLAHAHGTLLAVINLAFGATLERVPAWPWRSRRIASRCLIGATVLLPVGFFLGGLFPYEGDPGWGIFLVPVGGGLLAVSILLTAVAFGLRPAG